MDNYRTVIFDMDGTLLDTLDDLTDSVNHTLRALGRPERTRDEVRAFVGNGTLVLIQKSLGAGAEEALVQEAFTRYRAYYAQHAQIKTKPYNGILPLLRELRARGVRFAVASNKPEPTVRLLCEEYFPNLFDAAVGDVENRRRKPYPDMVDAALRALGAPKESAVYVGDTEVDAATARNSGLALLAVSWGFRPRQTLLDAGATVILNEPHELLSYVI